MDPRGLNRAARLAAVSAIAAASCGHGALRRPPPAPAACVASAQPVDEPPPPARAELVPAPPSTTAVWVDGAWTTSGRRWVWHGGGWVEPPAHATLSRWSVERGADASLVHRPATWFDAACKVVKAPAVSPAP